MKLNFIFLTFLILTFSIISCSNNSKEYEKLLLKQYDELQTNQIMDFETYFVRSQELMRPELESEFEKMKILKKEMYSSDSIYKKQVNINDKKIFIEKYRNKLKNIKSNVTFIDIKFLSTVNDSIFDAAIRQDFYRTYRDIMKDYWDKYHSVPYCGYTVIDSISK